MKFKKEFNPTKENTVTYSLHLRNNTRVYELASERNSAEMETTSLTHILLSRSLP